MGPNIVTGCNSLGGLSWWTAPVGSATLELSGCLHGGGGQWGVSGNLNNLEWLAPGSDTPSFTNVAWALIENLETLIVAGHVNNVSRIWSVRNIHAYSITNTGLTHNGGGQIMGWGTILGPMATANRGSNIFTASFLVNQGQYALIDGWSQPGESGHGSWMHIGGDLHNLDRALIRGYGYITVHGDFLNRGATLIGGNWNNHVHFTGDGMPGNPAQTYQAGHIGIWGNVYNISQNVISPTGGTVGGLITSFDQFQVRGSLFNDANSMITGSYTGGIVWIPDPDWTPPADDPDAFPPLIPIPSEATIEGRRANIIGGVLVNGDGADDRASELTVRGLRFPLNDDNTLRHGQPTFHGLLNAGHIREIDIISVGVDESTVLWNALATATAGATLPDGTPLLTRSATITDIGVINATNLINQGTINNIDVAINVSYMLWNDFDGVMDGFSAEHVRWTYIDDPTSQMHGGTLFRTTYDLVPGDRETRADLRVGRASEGDLLMGLSGNPLEELLGVPGLGGVGIVNYGTITNFETIFSQGDVINFGNIGADILYAPPTPFDLPLSRGGVTSLVIGSNGPGDGADFYNYGVLENVGSVTVRGDLFLGEGTQFIDVGTLAIRGNVLVEGTVAGGFRVMNAETGGIFVAPTGSLTIDRVSLASANTRVENYGAIINLGVLSSGMEFENYGVIVNRGIMDSGMSILNEGIIENTGVISSVNNFINEGIISGNGMVDVGWTNPITQERRHSLFRNEIGGAIRGGLTIHGALISHGTIALERGDVIRVTGDRATIVGGTVDVSEFRGAVVGGQYLFLATDNPGDLIVDSRRTLTATGSGEPGSVLDFIPVFGSRIGTQYVAGELWSRDNQFYWLEVKRAYQYGTQARTLNQIAVGQYLDRIGATVREDFSSADDRHRARPTGLWNMLAMLDGISDGYFNVDGTADRDIRNERNDPRRPVAFDPYFADHQGRINPAALRALDEMSGMIYANLGAASVHNYGVIHRSLADVLRSDVFKFSMIGNPNNAVRGQAIAPLRYTRWGTVFGIGGSSGHDSNADGYRTSFGGVMAGIDRAAWTGTRVGAYLSAGVGDVTMRHLNEKSDVTSVSVGMYLRQEMFYGYGLVSAGFGTDWYRTRRNLDMILHRAESRTHATIGTIYLERGIDIPVYYATIQPYASFQIVSVHQSRFTETMRNQFGHYANVGLEGVEGKTNSFKFGLGTRASSQPIPMRWGQLALSTNMAWFHDFQGKNDRDFIARFSNPNSNNFDPRSSGDTFRIYGNDPKRDWFNLGLGLNMDRNSTRIFLNGDLFMNSRQGMFTGGGGFITSW